jgi:hypothetical protein
MWKLRMWKPVCRQAGAEMPSFPIFVRSDFVICKKGLNIAPCQKKKIVRWCNGSTTDSDSVSLGSNPSRTT